MSKRLPIIGIACIAIGFIAAAAFYISFSNGSHEEIVFERKEAAIEGNQISILAPQEAELRSTEDLASFVDLREDADVKVVLVGVFPKLPSTADTSLNCSGLNRPILFQASLAAVEVPVDICENPLGIEGEAVGEKGYKIYGTSAFDHASIQDHEEVYLIQVIAKESYIQTEEGEQRLREIFESFEVEEL